MAKIHVDGRVPSRAENKLPASTEISNVQTIPLTTCSGATTTISINRMTKHLYLIFNVERADITQGDFSVEFTQYDGTTAALVPGFYDRLWTVLDVPIRTTEDIKVLNAGSDSIKISGVITYATAE